MTEHATERIDLRKALRLLGREWVLVVACVVLVGASALSLALSKPKQYTAAASLLFRDPAFDQKLFGSTFLGGSRDPDREAATNIALVGMKQVATRTANRAEIALSSREVQSAIAVLPDGRSDVVTVRATLGSPTVAATVANAFAAEFVSVRREADRKTILNAQMLVERQLDDVRARGNIDSPRANSLRERAEELSVLGSLQTGNAELVQSAEAPSGPSAPRPKRNLAVGLLLGLLLGVGLAFLRDRFDRRIRTVEDLGEALECPVLARVPMTEAFRGGLPPRGSRVEEAFTTLWTNLRYFNVTSGIDSILVTSPTSGDGKSTVALNLAAAAARSGSNVLLVEADLRRPSLALAVGRSRPPAGLTQVLAGVIPLERALERVAAVGGSLEPGDGHPEIDILFAGSVPPNPAQMLDSDAMQQLVRHARERYDLVVLDTPPLTVVPDPVPLLRQVSAVLTVGRLGSISRDAVIALRSQLTSLHAPVVGVVANYASDDGYGSAYYYQDRKAGPREPPRPVSSAIGDSRA